MKKLLLLVLGLLLIIVLSYFCFKSKAFGIKDDLISNTKIVYENNGLVGIDIGIRGESLEQTRILTLNGTVASALKREEAEVLAQNLDGVYAVDNQLVIASSIVSPKVPKSTIVVEAPSPYVISGVKAKDGKVTLRGYVDNNKVHDDLITEAKGIFGAENVIDKLKEEEGSPLEWYESSKLGLEKLSVVEYGHYKIIDYHFNFEGYVSKKSKESILTQELKSSLASDYKGTYDISSAITPSPYRISGVKAKDEKVILSGYVTTEKVHNDLIRDAKDIFGVNNVIDELQEAEGSPKEWYSSSKLGLENLALAEYGNFKIQDRDFIFEAYVATRLEKSTLIKNLQKGLSSSYNRQYMIDTPVKIVTTSLDTITVPEVKVVVSCQMQFKALLSQNKIHFAYNKANIKQESYELLDNLIVVAENCPNEILVVEGHTDSDGSESYNKKLSAKRASAVKKYFVKKGMNADRLEAIGYGELYPVANNGTKAGKEINRRIEINLKGER